MPPYIFSFDLRECLSISGGSLYRSRQGNMGRVRMRSVLVEGETCWRVREAERASVLVDAAGFFEHARSAMLKAERSIFLIGWDFDSRIDLVPGEARDEAPEKIGSFLNWLAKRREDLNIRILKWDIGLI